MPRIAFAIGGTSTDCVTPDAAIGVSHLLELPGTTRAPGTAVLAGLAALLVQAGIGAGGYPAVAVSLLRARADGPRPRVSRQASKRIRPPQGSERHFSRATMTRGTVRAM